MFVEHVFGCQDSRTGMICQWLNHHGMICLECFQITSDRTCKTGYDTNWALETLETYCSLFHQCWWDSCQDSTRTSRRPYSSNYSVLFFWIFDSTTSDYFGTWYVLILWLQQLILTLQSTKRSILGGNLWTPQTRLRHHSHHDMCWLILVFEPSIT